MPCQPKLYHNQAINFRADFTDLLVHIGVYLFNSIQFSHLYICPPQSSTNALFLVCMQ